MVRPRETSYKSRDPFSMVRLTDQAFQTADGLEDLFACPHGPLVPWVRHLLQTIAQVLSLPHPRTPVLLVLLSALKAIPASVSARHHLDQVVRQLEQTKRRILLLSCGTVASALEVIVEEGSIIERAEQRDPPSVRWHQRTWPPRQALLLELLDDRRRRAMAEGGAVAELELLKGLADDSDRQVTLGSLRKLVRDTNRGLIRQKLTLRITRPARGHFELSRI